MGAILLMLELQTIDLCNTVKDQCCYEEVLECAFDEGDALWCFQNYLEEKKRGD